MDDMEIVDPATGRSRFRVDQDNRVLSTCKHLFLDDRCIYCKKKKEVIDDANNKSVFE